MPEREKNRHAACPSVIKLDVASINESDERHDHHREAYNFANNFEYELQKIEDGFAQRSDNFKYCLHVGTF